MKVTVTMIVTAKMVLFVAEIIVLLEVEVIFFPELIVAQPQQVKIFASDGAMWICENLNYLWLDTDHFTEYSINCIPDSLGKKLKHCFDHLFGHSLAYFFFASIFVMLLKKAK